MVVSSRGQRIAGFISVAAWVYVLTFLCCSFIIFNPLVQGGYIFFTSGQSGLGSFERYITTTHVLSYCFGIGSLDPSLFTQREIIHMRDVQGLFLQAVSLLFFSILFLFVFWQDCSRTHMHLRTACGALLVITVALGILTSISFAQAFTTFHQIFFSNDYWILSADSMLIQLFPSSYFALIAGCIFLTELILCAVIIKKTHR